MVDRWSAQDLSRRLCHALDVAKQAVERLAPDGYTDRAQPLNNVRSEKIISETAFFLLAVAGIEDAAVRARADLVARMLVPFARSERMRLGVCLEPALALDYALAHVCLTKLGYEEPGFDALIREALRAQASGGRERPPHRMLEQSFVAGIWNGRPAGSRPSAGAPVKWSALNRPIDLLSGSREDIYALTHALMYVSRLPRPRSAILAEAEGALARCLDGQDYDLAGELLLAWPLTQGAWSAEATFAFRVVAHVDDSAGFLPAPTTRIERADSLSGDERIAYLLATAYHTVFVMGLLSAHALKSGCLPPRDIPTAGRAVPGAAAALIPYLDDGTTNPHWRQHLTTLNDAERDAIAKFLWNVAVYRSVNKRAFDVVRELLVLGQRLDLEPSPLSSQAAELLMRLSVFSTARAGVPAAA